MKENPCQPTCPKRSPTCHGTCKDYAEFREDREIEYKRRERKHRENFTEAQRKRNRKEVM